METQTSKMNYQKVYMNQIYSSSVMGQLSQMWKNQLLCDAVIKTGSVTTKAHRLVLIAACPMLQHLENASLGSHLEVRMAPDIKKDSILSFLQYLYEGYMILTEENCKDIEKMGKLLQVEGVVKCCVDFYKCLKTKTGIQQGSGPQFNFQDSVEFQHVKATDIQKMVQENALKRPAEPVSPLGKRQRMYQASPPTYQRVDDRASMSQSYHPEPKDLFDRLPRPDTGPSQAGKMSSDVIEIVEDSLEVVHKDPAERDPDGWPKETDLPPVQRTQSISVSSQLSKDSDIQVIDIDSDKEKRTSSLGLNTAKETISVRPSVSHDQSHSVHSIERHSFDSLGGRRDNQRFPELQRNDAPRLNESFQSSSTPSRAPAPSSSSSTSFSPKMPPLQPKPFAAGSAVQASGSQSVQGRPSITAGATIAVPQPSESVPSVSIQSTVSESQSQSTERTPSATSPAQQMSTAGSTDHGQSVEQLLAGEGIQERSSKADSSPSTSDMSDLRIVKIEESDTGGLDMYVDIPEENKSMMQSQLEVEGGTDDPGDTSVEWGRDEASNEGSNFSSDQGASWQGQDGSFQGLGHSVGTSEIKTQVFQETRDNKRTNCKMCGCQCSDEKSLMNHLEKYRFHGYVRVCLDCWKGFRSVQGYHIHRKMQHSSTQDCPICTVCGKRCPSRSNLLCHMKNHSEERLYTCPLCQKSFKHKHVLKRHMQNTCYRPVT